MVGRAQRWPNIDFASLAEVNPDVVGWVRMAGTPIDYPVVAGHLSESFYLSHNFSGEPSLHGQVALVFGCARQLDGPNTVLVAHTMSDWSMFRAVRALCDQSYLDAHPTVDLMAVDGTSWKGRWLAAARYTRDDPWPERTRFASEDDFGAWLESVVAQNWLSTGVRIGASPHVLTCCTCAKTPGPYDMRAAFALLEES